LVNEKDGDGQITLTELKDVLLVGNADITDDYWKTIIEEIDSNNDGMVIQSILIPRSTLRNSK
jgi:Ca2+-binding EF-hand superfamily protein